MTLFPDSTPDNTPDTGTADTAGGLAVPDPQQVLVEAGTWITGEMKAAYQALHLQGHAHSVEVWQDDELVGGLYGVAIGKVFFGESMFARRTDASKVAFVHLVRQLQHWGYALIDCQVYSEHLASLGAVNIPRPAFISLLNEYCEQPPAGGQERLWRFDKDLELR